MFKKSISCLLAALMIIASMPFSAISASAATSVRQVAQGVRVISAKGRYKTNELTLVNDQLEGNTDIGYVTFDISNVNVATDDVITANYTFNDLIENTSNNRESCGLNVYFATQNIDNDFHSSGSKGFSGITFTKSNNTYPNFISEVEQHYGLKKIASYPKIENLEAKNYSYNRTINLGPAIKEARLDGKDKLVVCFMLANKGGVDGAPWSDELVKITQTDVTVETSKIGTLVINSGAKTYSESYIGDTAKNDEYMKGFYKSGTWATQESNTTRITCQANTRLYSNFSVSGPVNAVAIYDTERKEIRFPVISYNAGGSGTHGIKIQYVALPSSVEANFSMGDPKWLRCSGTSNLTRYSKDDAHNFDSFVSTSNYNTNTFYTNETKQWRNFVRYTGSGNTDKYYDEVTDFSWMYSGVYGGNSATYADIPVTYGVYIVNILPLNQIITDKKSEYSNVYTDNWKYTDDSLARYYIAWQKIVNFDVSSYITTGTGEEAKVAAAAVKDLVNEYNTAYSSLTKKKLTITFRKHDNSTETKTITAGDKIGTLPANSIVENGEKQHDIYTWNVNADYCPQANTEYTETKKSTENHDFKTTNTCTCGAKVDAESFEAARTEAQDIINNQSSIYDISSFMQTVSTFVTKRANGEFLCQDDFDNATFEILYAKTKLKNNKGTVTLTVYDQNNQEITGAGNTYNNNYGDEITIKPATEQNVYKYVIEKDGTTSEIYGQQSISYVVTGNATVKAYCNEAQSPDKKYTKVTFLVGGKISDIKYVKEGEILDTSKANKLQFPFFTTGKWDKGSVEGKADVSSVTVRAELTPVDSDKCGIHIPGKDGLFVAHQMKYNTKVDLKDYGFDDSVDYALSKSQSKDDIIAYMHGTVFYVPARKDVYVLKVAKGDSTKDTKINTVGVFTSVDDKNKYVGFNCKFSLAEGCTPVEWGITFIPILPSGRPDSSQVFRVKALSAENEYTATLSLTKTNKKYSAIRAKAYLKYRDKGGNIQVKEGDEHIQAFATENKFGIIDINQNQN